MAEVVKHWRVCGILISIPSTANMGLSQCMLTAMEGGVVLSQEVVVVVLIVQRDKIFIEKIKHEASEPQIIKLKAF